MFLYIKNWNIVHRSKTKKQLLGFLQWCQILEENLEGNLIFENGKVKNYEKSKQREEDSNKYHLTKENNQLRKENKKLENIANDKVYKELELETKGQEANSYQRNIYLLKSMRWSQPL